MKENPEEETQTDVTENIWSYGKSISHLDSSENSMDDERKEIIRRSLGFDIIDIRSYAGYKGDLLVEITTMDFSVVESLKEIAVSLNMEIVSQKDVLSVYKIYCVSASQEGYELK